MDLRTEILKAKKPYVLNGLWCIDWITGNGYFTSHYFEEYKAFKDFDKYGFSNWQIEKQQPDAEGFYTRGGYKVGPDCFKNIDIYAFPNSIEHMELLAKNEKDLEESIKNLTYLVESMGNKIDIKIYKTY